MSSENTIASVLKDGSNLYVLDLSWLMYRGLYAHKELSVVIDGVNYPTGHIYGVFQSVKSIINRDPLARIILAQDGEPIRRKQIMASAGLTYKGGRVHDFDIYQNVKDIQALLCTIPGVYWAYNSDKESDDEMYAIAKKAEQIEGFKGKIYLYTGDNDLYQTISSRISIIKGITKKEMDIVGENTLKTNEKLLEKFKGVDPKHITNFRAIRGDSSDSIPGIKRFPGHLAYQIAMSTDDITKGYSYTATTNTEQKWINILEENKDIVNRNYQIMKLQSDYEVNIQKFILSDPQLLETEINKYEMKELGKWLSNLKQKEQNKPKRLF